MIAVYTISNVFSLCITEVVHDVEDYIKFYVQDNLSGKRSRICKSRVRTTTKGEAYFEHKKQRIYLDECMKV